MTSGCHQTVSPALIVPIGTRALSTFWCHIFDTWNRLPVRHSDLCGTAPRRSDRRRDRRLHRRARACCGIHSGYLPTYPTGIVQREGGTAGGEQARAGGGAAAQRAHSGADRALTSIVSVRPQSLTPQKTWSGTSERNVRSCTLCCVATGCTTMQRVVLRCDMMQGVVLHCMLY
jgi:hypothetical protein